jgi:AcrR family transcriptional regulator
MMSSRATIRRRGSVAGSAAGTSRRGSAQVTEVQRARMLHSAVAVISEVGYREMSVTRVTGRARMSRRTFYDLFEDREDCFLAVFDEAVARVSEPVVSAYEGQTGWREQLRAGLGALLELLDEDQGIASLLILDALGAGPRVLERRAELLARLGAALHEGGLQVHKGRELPALTGEGVCGAVFGVVHSRLLIEQGRSMVELLGPLMGMIVLPYLGPAAARKEIERPSPKRAVGGGARVASGARRNRSGDPLAGLPMRVTYRTLRVLSAIAAEPSASNRLIAHQAEVADQGQISKLLTRLERLGLIHNAAGQGRQPTGEPNAWALTPRGIEVQQALQPAGPDHRDATGHATAGRRADAPERTR